MPTKLNLGAYLHSMLRPEQAGQRELPRADLALSLFSFNLGVEIGQIVFVVLLFPLIDDLVRSGWTKLRPAVSIAIGLLAAFWFIQRAFFG